MAAPREVLSARDKEKLKEKLAFLQREYRRTVSRLQRAERAERVKSYVKKTVVEKNNLLWQAAAEEGPAGSTSRGPPEVASESIPAGSCSETSAVRTPSVTFNLEPAVFSRECCFPENSGSECTDGECGRMLGSTLQPVPERKLSRLSRSSRRGRPKVAPEERRDVAVDGDRPGHGGANWECPLSPFARRGSSSEPERSLPRSPSATTAKQRRGTTTPVTPQLGTCQGPLGEYIVPGVLSLLPGRLLEKSWGPSLEPPWEEGLLATLENSAVKDCGWLADGQNVSKGKERDGEEEEKEDLCRTASPESGSETPQERHPFGEPQSSRHCHSGCPGWTAGSGGDAGEEEVSPAAPTSSLRDSCTVVEGLLFPVEYYVRTTRRMSQCQQEPNLAAVIQSQLGRRRRRRARGQQDGVAAPASSPQRLPACPPAVGQEGGCRSPLASNESPGQGEGRPLSSGLAQRSQRGRRKGRGWSRPRAPCHGAQGLLASAGLEGNGHLTSRKAGQSEPQEQAQDRGHAGVEPAESGTVSRGPSEPSGASWRRQTGSSAPGQRGSQLCGGAPEPPSPSCLGIPSHLHWLPSDLAPQEFHLPADEFGLLLAEKARASATEAPEMVGAGESVEHLQGADDADLEATEEGPGDVSPEDRPTGPFSFLSPANAVLEGENALLDSQLPTPLFPLVGATPATQDFCDAPWQAQASSPREPSARAAGKPTSGLEEEQCRTGTLCPEDEGGAHREHDEAAVSLEARQELEAESRELGGASAEQVGGGKASLEHGAAAEGLASAPGGWQGGKNLQMTSKLKNPPASCSVDVSTVWWEAAGCTQLCIVTACETAITLWRRLGTGCWETAHTWTFDESLVFQLVPLPGAHSLVCVALGSLEIAELRLLFHSLEDGCPKQSPPVKAGNIKAVLGLSGRRLVSSCDGAVEVLSFPDAGGSCTRQTLLPPEETTLAFAAVDRMAEALVGLTASNCMVVWNLSTGQRLCQMPLGYAYPVPVCHQAYADSGLLFVVLSHPCAKESNSCGSPAFQVVAFNPKTAKSAQVTAVTLPPGLQGRYLEGDVRDASAAAVLTSGAIAVWDLLGGECTALLPPSAQGSWSFVRWSVTDKYLLAGQMDGSVCIYSYVARPCLAPEVAERSRV